MCNLVLSVSPPLPTHCPPMLWTVVVRPHQERNHPHKGQHRGHLRSPRRRQMARVLDQRGNCRTLAWTSLPLWCKADCETQSLQVVHFLVTAGWRNIAKYLGLENDVIGESKATQTGLHGAPPKLKKRKCVSTSLMRREHLECTETQSTSINNSCQ